MGIERDIHHLLYTHDCVVVPGFGGFLTHYRPARLDEQRKLVHPPAKDLSFNRHLVRQDGLLSDQLARREGLDYRAAIDAVDQEVGVWKKELDVKGRLEVGHIGTFFRDAESNLQFEPDKRVNFLKDAYGLRPVAANPVVLIAPTPIKQPAPKPIGPVAVPLEETPHRSRSFLLAAAMVAILLTGATWFTVTTNDPKGAIWSGFDLFRTADAPRYALPGPATSVVEGRIQADPAWSPPEDLFGIHPLPIAGSSGPMVAVNMGQVPAKAEPESTAVTMPVAQARYHIIGGCFQDKENADRLISVLQAKGFAASLIDVKGGLYRVAYGSYPSRATALEALNAVRKEEAPDAWMLVK